jgi:hypothetical protein
MKELKWEDIHPSMRPYAAEMARGFGHPETVTERLDGEDEQMWRLRAGVLAGAIAAQIDNALMGG